MPPAAGQVLETDFGAVPRLARSAGIAPLPLVVVRQAWAEVRLRLLAGIGFRQRDNRAACSAYLAMSVRDFAAINARQAWANWRTIPRNLHQRLPWRPVRIIDLCCGIGQSTAVLARYAHPGSRLLGLEHCPELVTVARATAADGQLRDPAGQPAQVAFAVQSVLDPFLDENGVPVPDGTCDVVHASGAVACHFDTTDTAILLGETTRVLRPGGLALIDAGSSGTTAAMVQRLGKLHGLREVHRARSCWLDRAWQLCLVKDGVASSSIRGCVATRKAASQPWVPPTTRAGFRLSTAICQARNSVRQSDS